MGSPQRDHEVRQLRGDVDGLYDLTSDTSDTAMATKRAVREVDLRLRKLQVTTGRQFGVVIATLRQHGKRLDRVDEQLDRVGGQLDRVDEQLGQVDGRLGQVDGQLGQIGQRLDQINGQLLDMSQTLETAVGMLRVQQPPTG
ncbi:hypothetical protein [Nocardia nepalensis]|uniref:hypothetical protein n=1 Tax=Nocardia nepalensis TaxID=3375448 RepID=UPI003B6758A3